MNKKPAVRATTPIFFYDANCIMCTRWSRWAEQKAKGRLHLEALQGKLAKQYALDMRQVDSAHLFTAQKHHVRSSAIVGVLLQLGGVWRVLGWGVWLVPKPIRDLAYNVISRHRRCRT